MKFQIPSKLLFTHFMERSASVANIKCGEVATYLPIYTADYLLIGRFAPLFHARGFASGILIYRFGFYSGAANHRIEQPNLSRL
jgi:hypothetical protein